MASMKPKSTNLLYIVSGIEDPDGRVILVKDRGNPEDFDAGDLKDDN